MQTHQRKASEDKSYTTNEPAQHLNSAGESSFDFTDNHAQQVVMRKLNEKIQNSPRVKQLMVIQRKADHYTKIKEENSSKIAGVGTSKNSDPIQRKTGNSGLPEGLKAGVEHLSGYSLSDVKVHRNSDKPAQLQAHAYAQGNEIHLGPGQEKHLPHEAWHVVQQKQGRVSPTVQMKGNIQINDNASLEREADVMGSKAQNMGLRETEITQLKSSSEPKEVAQLMGGKWFKKLRNRLKGSEEYESLLDDGSDSESLGQIEAVAGPEAEVSEVEPQDGVLVEAGPFSYQDGVVTMEVWPGQQISFGESGLSGSLPSKEFEMDIGSLEASVDIPFAPGAYATVALGITPTLAVSIAGGTFAIGNKSLSIEGANITGTMGLDITAKAGAGVGVSNVAGLAAGGFASLGGEASLAGSLGGTVNFDAKKYDVNLALNANADIVGKAGLFVEAKALGYRATKKWVLASKKFAHFSYRRGQALTGKKGAWAPKLSDFTKIEYGDYSNQDFLETDEGYIYSNDPDYEIHTPLLSKGSRSEG